MHYPDNMQDNVCHQNNLLKHTLHHKRYFLMNVGIKYSSLSLFHWIISIKMRFFVWGLVVDSRRSYDG